MRIDPAIAALRRDRAPQRRAQAVMKAAWDAWREEPETSAVLAQLAEFGRGAPLQACPALASLFGSTDSAQAVMGGLSARFCAALKEAPLAHPPFRYGYGGGHSTVLLARSGRARLVVHGSEPGRRDLPRVADFSDAERFEIVLAGRADARLVRRAVPSGRFDEEPVALQPGACLAMDLSSEALQILEVQRQLVILRLQRTAAEPRPSREYDLADGKLLGQSAAELRISRHEMIVALLGRMGRADAAPTMAALAREPGDDSLRWQALRECLALDTAAGFEALCVVSRRGDDPLAAPAGALRAQLLEAHPQLVALEDGSCPA